MTAVWRIGIESPGYRANDLSSMGARLTGGRWNSEGVPMVYASASIALAMLETLVHLGGGDLPFNRFLVRIDIPEAQWNARSILEAPGGWDAIPAGITSRTAGDMWCAGARSLLLAVPSVVVPEEHNILINPRHADARLLNATTVRRLAYDPRTG
ncbi:RES domain-containing protein [Pseudoduganella flava]|uniref:RES domain-containing protein n=1 Tax=Pseudoduganella flava TaxID=871742 RepID=A0A562PG54_9BURK|nr:RES family NAD+ phosphorylase [Pseudoduganella flava]QGZ40226.1 RES domain-containing protein [Pseudoduganella flava]TWI43407.1 RES domain-containing protein [Pseudoduganella flava]